MEAIIKEKKQSSSIHQKIRKAEFVHIKSDEIERFKYLIVHNILKKVKSRLINIKRKINSITHGPILLTSKVDWQQMRNDILTVSIETIIEGVTANFATHYLFGLPFNPGMIIAHGIIIRQGISIFSRLKKDGANTTIPQKDK